MVGERLVLSEDRLGRVRVGHVWIGSGNLVAGHHGVARDIRVIDVEESVVSVVGMEGEAEQTALAATAHQSRDVQERCGKKRATIQDPDLSRLLNNEDAATAVPGIRDRDWRCETGGDLLQLDGRPGWGAARELPGEIGR